MYTIIILHTDGGRSKYKPEISKEEIKEIILREMDEQGVKVTDIPKETEFRGPKYHGGSKRYFSTKGFAWFTCKKHNGDRHWPSAHAWCFIDLKEQEICHRYTQDCKRHNTKAELGPEFTEEALKKMAA